MRRVYNTNISDRANRCLARREAEVRTQKLCIALTLVFIIAVAILLGTSIHVFASDNTPQTLHKYYKTICVEKGDTLWDIAEEYAKNTNMSRKEYIREICRINGICEDEIYAGEYIVVMYYDVEN